MEKHKHLMKGRVLDIGGKKTGKRGMFSPPIENVELWEYLNTDQSTNPDYCCDAEEIPLPDQSIDTVIMTELLEYLSEPKKVLSEIYRIAKDSCQVLISAPLLNPIHGDYMADRARYSTVMLRELAEETGFQIIKIETMGSVGAVVYDILRAAFGYTNIAGRYSKWGKLLYKSKGFFFWLDKILDHQKRYINTGYLMIIKKS